MKKYLCLIISLLTLTVVSCSDDNGDIPGYQEAKKFEKQIVGKSWVANIASSLPDVEILCQYDLNKNHTALCQLMSIDESESDDWHYTLDSVDVKWEVVPNYLGFAEANLQGPALKIVADNTETHMIIKSVDDEKMVCLLASGERSEEVVFDKILDPLDVEAANKKLESYNKTSSDDKKFSSRSLSPSNWMKNIPDDMKVCDMSIPGTHDAATYNVAEAISFGALCQDLNLYQQWDAGVRVFDLRIRQGYLYHDFIPCNMSLDVAIRGISKRVLEHKDTDGAIIICKTEGNHFANKMGSYSTDVSWFIDYCTGIGIRFDDDVLNERKTVDNLNANVNEYLIKNNLLAEFKPDMTMKDLRGKVLVINRNDLGPKDCYGPLANGWDGNQLLTTSDGTQAAIYVQDEYEPGKNESDNDYIKRKKQYFKDVWDYSRQVNENTWVVNQASGFVYDLFFPNYAALAEEAYPSMIEAVKGFHGKGLILQDYAGVDKTCRVSAKVTAPLAIAALAVPSVIGMRKKALEGVLYLAKKVLSDDHVKGAELVNAVIDNNFRND